MTEIASRLFAQQDEGYQAFQRKLVPTADPARIIGVRVPALRALARELRRDGTAAPFLAALPHDFFEEDMLHAVLLAAETDFGVLRAEIERFLPYIDNWAVCDVLSPKAFRRHTAELLPCVDRWLASEREFTVRFGIKMLMDFYLGDGFRPEYAERVAAVRDGRTYVHLMIAWYFATALAKQYDAALPFLEERRLAPRTHDKAIRKALESFRVTEGHKAYLRTLRLHGAER